MTSPQEAKAQADRIKRIVAAINVALEEVGEFDYSDVLNAVTEILITTLKTNEFLTTTQAYQCVVDCFSEAIGKPQLKPPYRTRLTKFEKYQRRQALVARRKVGDKS